MVLALLLAAGCGGGGGGDPAGTARGSTAEPSPPPAPPAATDEPAPEPPPTVPLKVIAQLGPLAGSLVAVLDANDVLLGTAVTGPDGTTTVGIVAPTGAGTLRVEITGGLDTDMNDDGSSDDGAPFEGMLINLVGATAADTDDAVRVTPLHDYLVRSGASRDDPAVLAALGLTDIDADADVDARDLARYDMVAHESAFEQWLRFSGYLDALRNGDPAAVRARLTALQTEAAAWMPAAQAAASAAVPALDPRLNAVDALQQLIGPAPLGQQQFEARRAGLQAELGSTRTAIDRFEAIASNPVR